MENAFVLALALCMASLSLRAQDHYVPGYIVRVSGDTLNGFLKEQGTDESAERISFKASATDNDYQVYSFNEVKSFQYTDGNLFRAIVYPDTRKDQPVTRTVYGNLLVNGEYDLYAFTEDGILYFLVQQDTSIYLIWDDDIRSFPYVKGNFRNELNFFATSCDAAREEVDRIAYTRGSVMDFFQKIDACVNPGKVVVTAYHKPKGNAGIYAYAGGIPLGNNSEFAAELRLRMVWPQMNPNVSFNLGVRYVELDKKKVPDPYYLVATIYHHKDYQIESLPLTIEYNITHGVVVPFVFAGASLCTLYMETDDPALIDNLVYYHRVAISPVAGGGIEVRLVPVLWVRAEWRYECMAQYPTLGLAVTLP